MDDQDDEKQGIVTNIKNSIRDSGEVMKDNLERQIDKVEKIVMGEGQNTKNDIELLKEEVRGKNTILKNEMNERITGAENLVKSV